MMNPMLELLRKLKKMDIADRLSALSELADRGWTYCYLSNSLWWASGIGLGFYAYCRRSGGWGSYFWSGRPLHYYKTVFGSWSVNHFFFDWQYEPFCSACEKNQSAKLWHRTCHCRNTSYMAPSIYYPCVMTHGNSWFCFVLAFWMWFHEVVSALLN